MFEASEVYTLKSGRFLMDFEEDLKKNGGVAYHGQLMFFGPDASIEVNGRAIRAFMNGMPTENSHFAALIDNYKRSILKEAAKLRKSRSDTVVFTGVWYHVDFNERPRFEPYVIHVVSAVGDVISSRYALEMFDSDSPGEGFYEYPLFKALTVDETLGELRYHAEALTKLDDRSPQSSGFKALQGVIWYPAGDEPQCAPIVVIRATGSKAYLAELSDRPSVPPGSPEAFVRAAKACFQAALADASARGAVTEELQFSYDHLRYLSKQGFIDAGDADGRWALAQLASTSLGVHQHKIVERGLPTMPITLTEMANSTDVDGFWMQVRGSDGVPLEPLYSRFADMHRVGQHRDPDALLHPIEDVSDAAHNCRYSTGWLPVGQGGLAMRYMALGDVPKLSW
ncbi:hypothetical protein [Rhizobium leguminosarum]|uniref:hypothetical protein n=1 Tax=Rhizobium leguminosarum TaxID=384 RepID=UPI003CFD1FEB